MKRVLWLSVVSLVGSLATAPEALAQRSSAYIAYAYPAGGQQGTTVQVRLGGQRLTGLRDAVVSGTGVTAKLVKYHRNLGNQELTLLREQLNVLRREATAKTRANEPVDETEKELVARIEERIGEWVNRPACASHAELAFVEVTIDPQAEPGPREIRLITAQEMTNPLVFCVGQLPEVARKAMKTAEFQVLGKEHLAQRKRPDDEVEVRISVPCTMNGQIASGEVNRYRLEARKGQQLVITTQARQLIPYIADAVPGWFQPVLVLRDADGRDVAFNDDYRFNPDPTLLFDVPEDGEYLLEITDAIYRGREDFVYRVSIGELPFVTSIFPLGARAGEPVSIEHTGWNLDAATLSPPPQTTEPGVHRIAAQRDGMISNSVPFALDTLPECLEKEPNNDPPQAQNVEMPTIINGRMDHPNDCDVFQIQGRAGDTLVAEVTARRLDSALDSLLKVTDASGKVLAFNDDREDLASGLNTHHADSYVMLTLPADGVYRIHLVDTARHGGPAYAYRLRIGAPRPDFALRSVPSRLSFRPRGNATLTVYAFRKDGFTGDILLRLAEPIEGFTARPVTLPAGKDNVRFSVTTRSAEAGTPINLVIEGLAKTSEGEIVREVVPAEDWMQAFLWRHLVPAQDLKALVFDPSYTPPPKREPPAPQPEPTDKPAAPQPEPTDKPAVKPAEPPKFTKQQVTGRLRQLGLLYNDWLLTEEFYAAKVAECEAVQGP